MLTALLRRISPYSRRRHATRPAAVLLLAVIALRILSDGALLAMAGAEEPEPLPNDAPAWTVFAEHAGHDCGHCVAACFEGRGHQCMLDKPHASEFGLIRFEPLCGGSSHRGDRALAEGSAGKYLPPAHPVFAPLPPPAPQASPPVTPRSFHPSIDTPPPEA